MSNKEIRQWAYEHAKGKRGTLLGAAALILLPTFLRTLTRLLLQLWDITLPIWWDWPLHCLSRFLFLGTTFLALEIVQDREVTAFQVFAPFKSQWLKKAILWTLVVTVVQTLLGLYPSLLEREGRALMAQGAAWRTDRENWVELWGIYLDGEAMVRKASGLSLLLSTPVSILMMPVNYLLFLRPELSFGQLAREGLEQGFRSWFKTFGFFLGAMLPFLGVMLITAFLFSVNYLAQIVWVILLFAFVCWWYPWWELAIAKYMDERLSWDYGR